MKTNLMGKNILQKLFHPIMSSQSNMKYDPEMAKTKRYNVATGQELEAEKEFDRIHFGLLK